MIVGCKTDTKREMEKDEMKRKERKEEKRVTSILVLDNITNNRYFVCPPRMQVNLFQLSINKVYVAFSRGARSTSVYQLFTSNQ